MQTASVMIQSLCVPCNNRCRHCLLSWNGRVEGAPWERSVALAERYLNEIKEQKPFLRASFTFGCSMEHPDLKGAIRTLRRLGSPMAEMLQCDGMKERNESECRALMEMLRDEGIKQLNFTVYGLADYHDRFAGRRGDHALLVRMMRAAGNAGIPFSVGIVLTRENLSQIDELVRLLNSLGSEKTRLFVPHEEGRGRFLADVRVKESDLSVLAPETRALLNKDIYRTEGDWLKEENTVKNDKRLILISLRKDNIEEYEKRGALSVVEEIESLDEAYYAAFPAFSVLADLYGDRAGEKLYRVDDLYRHFRQLYASEHSVKVYDVTDERLSGSRRY